MLRTRLIAILSAAALAAGGSVGFASTAGASALSDVALVCPGSTTVNYSPSVTDTTRPTRVAGQSQWTCNGLPAGYSATNSGTITVPLSCTDLLQSTTGTKILRWTRSGVFAGTSTFSLTRTVTRAEGTTTVVFTGPITAGLFEGATVIETAVVPNLELDACSTTGISQLDFTETLEVTGL
ncbi:hypothetical protein [Streptomyces longwoodensis]|uniref:hypothetical protein n=1 Tax=Streptomyces longwoodensis TaxID=68231 RepID=UPI0033ECE150